MAQFGKYRIRAALDHLVIGGHDQDYSFPAGDLEPATAEEAAALDHLCQVSYTSPDGTESYTFAELLEPADPAEPAPAPEPVPAQTAPAADTPPAPAPAPATEPTPTPAEPVTPEQPAATEA